MKYDPDIHHRRSVRLRGYDYSGVGAYFVTICVHGRECLLGEVVDGAMRFNQSGEIVRATWNGLPGRFPNVTLDVSVIMPNHFHGIIVIDDVGALLAAPDFEPETQGQGDAKDKGAASGAPTLGKIVRTFKSISAIEVNRLLDRQGRPLWQRNYYERIIRNDDELAATREYIMFNPMKWAEDMENPVITAT